jgi:[acyl-carrier-protein] S-malonyltransferase
MSTSFVFPGQGTQRVGMGQTLHSRYPEAREVFDRASEILAFDVARTCFRASPDDLRATQVAQPVIFVVSAAALAVLQSWGIEPGGTAGHSVGEIAALYAAEVFDFDTALHVVRTRAAIMAGVTEPGAMLTVAGLDLDELHKACDDAAEFGPVCIGLHNAPRNFVLSGAVAPIAAAAERCRALGAIKVTRLHTQHAFHSPLMEPVVGEWRGFVSRLDLKPPAVPVALNATGAIARDPEDIRAALVDQVASTVLWSECVGALCSVGARRFVEVGDAKVLGALVRAHDRDLVTVTMSDPRAVRRAFDTEGCPGAVC